MCWITFGRSRIAGDDLGWSDPIYGVKDIVEQTKESYTGPFEVGEDLTAFDITAGGVKMIPFQKK